MLCLSLVYLDGFRTKVEHRTKFLDKLLDNDTETLNNLTRAYGEQILSLAQVFSYCLEFLIIEIRWMMDIILFN